MTKSVPRAILLKVRKLAQLLDEARHSSFAVSITRLTVLNSLCRKPEVANRFVTFLARKTLKRVKKASNLAHRDMMTEVLAALESWQRRSSEQLRRRL